MSSNSSITSWIPGNLEFISSVEIFISSFPSFQIGSFSWILVLIFLCLLLCPNFLYCFYDSYSSDLWKIPTRLILKSFSYCAIIFNLWRVNMSPDVDFIVFFPHHFSLFLTLHSSLEWNYHFSPNHLSIYWWFCGCFYPWPCSVLHSTAQLT